MCRCQNVCCFSLSLPTTSSVASQKLCHAPTGHSACVGAQGACCKRFLCKHPISTSNVAWQKLCHALSGHLASVGAQALAVSGFSVSILTFHFQNGIAGHCALLVGCHAGVGASVLAVSGQYFQWQQPVVVLEANPPRNQQICQASSAREVTGGRIGHQIVPLENLTMLMLSTNTGGCKYPKKQQHSFEDKAHYWQYEHMEQIHKKSKHLSSWFWFD